jgi:hypothetical protein
MSRPLQAILSTPHKDHVSNHDRPVRGHVTAGAKEMPVLSRRASQKLDRASVGAEG